MPNGSTLLHLHSNEINFISGKVIGTNIIMLIAKKKKHSLLYTKYVNIMHSPSGPTYQNRSSIFFPYIGKCPHFSRVLSKHVFCRSLKKFNDFDPITPDVCVAMVLYLMQVN